MKPSSFGVTCPRNDDLEFARNLQNLTKTELMVIVFWVRWINYPLPGFVEKIKFKKGVSDARRNMGSRIE